MDWGGAVIAWSIRLSMLLFVATLLSRMLVRESVGRDRAVKIIWTASYFMFLIHVLAAFHFAHHWDHAAAYRDTAKQTRELLGYEFGGGVYFNYAFMLAWAFHVASLWLPATTKSWPMRWLVQLSLLYLLFIAFNGVVVFKSGWMRFSGVLAVILLGAALVAAVFRRPKVR